MPTYRFESVDSAGVPIHGILSADSESDLRELLARRGQRLVSAQPQTVLGNDSDIGGRIPRMVQLRIGESLRAAFLTQIPAQDALRAAAREPMTHPLEALFPWLQCVSLFLLLLAAIHASTIGAITTPLITLAIAAMIAIPFAWGLAVYTTRVRPRRILVALANRLDSGQADIAALVNVMPRSLQAVANADMPDDAKSRAIAELASRPSVSSWARHRFAAALFGSGALCFAASLAIYGFLMVPMPQFRQIFEDFDMELPVLTQQVLDISRGFQRAGVIGFAAICLLGIIPAVLFYGILYRGWGAAQLQSIPVLGTGLKWVNLARVSRLLAVLIRNNCPPGESLRVAASQTAGDGTSDEGDRLADRIEERQWIDGAGSALDGLPVSLLLTTDTTPNHRKRRAVAAETFDGLASMFEQSVSGYGTLISGCVQFAALLLVVGVIGLMLFAAFIPLVNLLNALS